MTGGFLTDSVGNLNCVGFGKYILPVLIDVKNKVRPITCHEDTEGGSIMYSSTLFLTSALDGGGMLLNATSLQFNPHD